MLYNIRFEALCLKEEVEKKLKEEVEMAETMGNDKGVMKEQCILAL